MSCKSDGINPTRDCSKYHKQALIFHPDKNRGCTEEATQKFQMLENFCPHGKTDKTNKQILNENPIMIELNEKSDIKKNEILQFIIDNCDVDVNIIGSDRLVVNALNIFKNMYMRFYYINDGIIDREVNSNIASGLSINRNFKVFLEKTLPRKMNRIEDEDQLCIYETLLNIMNLLQNDLNFVLNNSLVGGKKKKKKTIKKKKIIKKIYKGGYPDPNFIAIDQNDYLRIHSMTNYNTEVCGNFFIDDWNEAQIDEQIGTSRGGRSVCRHKRYSQFIWHTHPQHGKYYPSAEDIIKIMKNNHKIQRSWIFTTYGYWTMEYTGDHIHVNNDGSSYLYDMLLNEYPRVVNGSGIIDEINDWFYEETNRGREYNNYMIWEYINALESNIPGLEIWWYDF
jgi:hypothetical protein